MILQSIILPNKICSDQELYYRSDGKVTLDNNSLILDKNAYVKTNTYMNCFDCSIWNQYTGINSVDLTIEFEGEGNVVVYDFYSEEVYSQTVINSNTQVGNAAISIDMPEKASLIAFEITTSTGFHLKKAYYNWPESKKAQRHVHLSLIICTYKRNKAIKENLQMLKSSLFFDESSMFYGGMSIRIIDNASELPQCRENYVNIYHNPNTGGSGGFTRGIIETRNDKLKYNITHVIFMDDDVEFVEETFYRLFALLKLVKPEYENQIIAGRMFRLDKRNIQHTSSEIWNSGNIIHVGNNLDMCDEKNLLNLNQQRGEYTGWWFGCFPMAFVDLNLPFPFFLHCDDVEYGLRHGGIPIVLNGIQVWHETYEHRTNPAIVYYDTRNALVINAFLGYMKDEDEFIKLWKNKLGWCYHSKNEAYKFVCVLAMWHFSKGISYFKKGGKVPDYCIRFYNKKRFLRLLIPLMHRLVEYYTRRKFDKIKNSYEKEKIL